MNIHTELNKGRLDVLLKSFLKRHEKELKLLKRKRTTLFDIEPNFEWVKAGKCGICNKPLKVTKNGRIAYCGRKKCLARPPFVITIEKLYKLKMK